MAGPGEIHTRPFQLVTGRVWKGTAFGGYRSRSQLPGLVNDYMKGSLKSAMILVPADLHSVFQPCAPLILSRVDEFITGRVPLTRINEAFAWMKDGSAIRTMVDF